MEPFPKRQRLYSPFPPSFPQSFDSEDVYYDEDDFVVDEEEEEEEEEENGDAPPDIDPESEFQQKRARLDYKLKSTFEAIFEKYGKDFDGVGDEIDLATGEIVVNNGHVLDMLDERDAGDIRRAQSVPTEDTEESEDLLSSALEEVSDMDEDEDEEEDDGSEVDSEDELVEDDLILRGFAQANRFMRPSPESGSLRKPAAPPQKIRKLPVPHSKIPKKSLPAQSEILAQFGPQLGPQILEYISKQSVPDNSGIEPAWRAPEISAFKPRKREVKKPVILPPEPQRSPSPKEATSIWAVPRRRGPNKVPRLSGATNHGGESSVISKHQARYDLDPLGLSDDVEDFEQTSPQKKKRRKFTDEDDQILLNWVTRVRQKGLTLSDPLWRELAAKHPIHNWMSWRYRYKHHFTYLLSNSTEDSEVSVSEPSVDSLYVGPQTMPAHRTNQISHGLAQDTTHVRPNRVRKPAQKDSRIISWSEAVHALESLDPDLHAGILEDTRVMKTDNRTFGHSPPAPTRQGFRTANPIKPADVRPNIQTPKPPPREVIDLTDDLSDVEAASVQERHLIPGAPCPHANCRLYPTNLYRLQRRDDEELSEMCLHLFRSHHTTPFPCGETNCPRKGEEGYFMQADLVKHVRTAHLGIGALQRLRGRVESELLDRNIELATPPHGTEQILNRPVSQPRDSDFMSARNAPSTWRPITSHQRCSTSDHDRTPRAPTTNPGASHSTPMTSVSSLRVPHPSATKASIEEQIENVDENRLDDLSLRAHRSTIDSSGGLGSTHVHAPSSLGPPAHNKQESYSHVGNPLPTSMTATGASLGSAFSFSDERARQSRTLSGPQQAVKRSINQKTPAIINETPDPASPQAQASPEVLQTACFSTLSSVAMRHTPPARNIGRNILDPSYEFSDEEGHPELVSKAPSAEVPKNDALPKPVVATSSMAPPPAPNNSQTGKISKTTHTKKQRVVKPALNLSFSTPAAQKAIRQSILRMALDAEDFDELSLGKDDIILLSSRRRTKSLSATEPMIKQEDVMNTPRRPVPGTATRKRAFSIFQERSSPDELAEDEPSPASKAAAAANPQIKVEEDSLPEHPPTLPNHKPEQMGKEVRSNNIPSAHKTHSMTGRHMAIRTSTPLLNLTPSRQAVGSKEIRDSVSDSSFTSPTLNPPQRARANRLKEVDSSSSPLSNILTPTREKPTEDFLKAEQVTVVVKTPGGTFRRCGEDGFTCGRSFCFRCGSQSVQVSSSR